ncbi:MAG TPA: hypothetical protein VJH34_02700 [archaeon]|nr:hypothetical protein [archaeon]
MIKILESFNKLRKDLVYSYRENLLKAGGSMGVDAYAKSLDDSDNLRLHVYVDLIRRAANSSDGKAVAYPDKVYTVADNIARKNGVRKPVEREIIHDLVRAGYVKIYDWPDGTFYYSPEFSLTEKSIEFLKMLEKEALDKMYLEFASSLTL